ncbi:MAG: hypothetical protein WEB62_03360, partial [Bacteroidota bacterium]
MIHDEQFGTPQRRNALMGAILLIFAVLMVRLYQLQLLYHGELDKKSEENSIRALIKEPIRGYIYDRTGKLVVDVGPSYTVMIVPSEFDKRTMPLLSSLLEMEPRA